MRTKKFTIQKLLLFSLANLRITSLNYLVALSCRHKKLPQLSCGTLRSKCLSIDCAVVENKIKPKRNQVNPTLDRGLNATPATFFL